MTTNPSPETVAAMARAIERAFHSYTFASAEESDPDILDAIATWRGDKDVGPAIEHLQTVCAFAAHDALAALAAAPPSAGEGEWKMAAELEERLREVFSLRLHAFASGLLSSLKLDVPPRTAWDGAVDVLIEDTKHAIRALPSPPVEEAK